MTIIHSEASSTTILNNNSISKQIIFGLLTKIFMSEFFKDFHSQILSH